MSAERHQSGLPNRASTPEDAVTISPQTTDLTPDSAADAPTIGAQPGASPPPPKTLGRYEVRRTLGAGGFGAVYLGHDSQLDRPVALKVLRAGARAGKK